MAGSRGICAISIFKSLDVGNNQKCRVFTRKPFCTSCAIRPVAKALQLKNLGAITTQQLGVSLSLSNTEVMFHFGRCHKWALANGSWASFSHPLSRLSERRQRVFLLQPRYSKSISTTGEQWKYHFHHAVAQTSSILKMKMSIEG